VREAEAGVAVHAGRHVEPLDEHRPIERVGVCRPAHQDAGPVRRGADAGDRPAPVLTQLAHGLVGGCLAFEDVLLLDVPVAVGEPRRHRVERLVVDAPGDGTGHHGTGHVSAGNRAGGFFARPRVTCVVVIARGPARSARGRRDEHTEDRRGHHQGLRSHAGTSASLDHVSPPASPTPAARRVAVD
jgi:hypothetical protein